MDYDLDLWRDRVDHLLEITANPEDILILERAEQAIAIGNQPESSDQIAIEDLWAAAGEVADEA